MRCRCGLILLLLLVPILALLQAQVPTLNEVAAERGITPTPTSPDQHGAGAAIADFDNDGDLDFYLPTDAGLPDRLYRNDGTGYFQDVAAELGIQETGLNRAALWLDYDGDQRLDLVVAGENCFNLSCTDPIYLALYRQRADGTFQDVTASSGLALGTAFDNLPYFAIGGLAAGDIDQDHYLDLLLTVWGGGVRLFRNQGDGTFTDVTAAWGLSLEQPTPWQPMFADFDGDGRTDIYCNVDFAENKLWLNRGNRFVEQAAAFGLNSAFNEMGMALSDADNDGDLDLYLTNITRELFGLAQYNVLLKQEYRDGRIRFRESARSLGVSQSGWDWGTTFADLNNDSRQDLLTTNGWWDERAYGPDASRLWLNTAAGFVDVSAQCGFNDVASAATVLGLDLDRDGDTDFLQTRKDFTTAQLPVRLYENRLEELSYPQHYVTIRPRMPGANHYAIGSLVTVVADDLRSARAIHAGCSFYGQEAAEAHFGLGARTEIKEIVVTWPTGEVSIYPDLASDRVHTLDYAVLAPPTELSATTVDGHVHLEWRDNSEQETGFLLYRSEDSLFNRSETFAVGSDVVNYVDAAVEPAKTYYYRVRARREYVYSDDSNVSTVRTANVPPDPRPEGIVYPNPTVDHRITVRLDTAYAEPIPARLFSRSKREVWSGVAVPAGAEVTYPLPPALPPGLYLLWIGKGTTEQWHKIILTSP